ncbi:hypothetical protein BaRGS_00000364 [Batillaria attramentaria]|uniref:Uncharacterized protein n=1 Tax=Batillaria attramentaria TaxID=370345 RepID=A0ABD0M9K3_9CAEN
MGTNKRTRIPPQLTHTHSLDKGAESVYLRHGTSIVINWSRSYQDQLDARVRKYNQCLHLNVTTSLSPLTVTVCWCGWRTAPGVLRVEGGEGAPGGGGGLQIYHEATWSRWLPTAPRIS